MPPATDNPIIVPLPAPDEVGALVDVAVEEDEVVEELNIDTTSVSITVCCELDDEVLLSIIEDDDDGGTDDDDSTIDVELGVLDVLVEDGVVELGGI